MSSLKYRADIDGLRAIAVLGVVIYHAFPWLIPGGFIGVDIFFVISGYLISGILYKGLKANGGDGNFSPFSFREFYARRIRRLFPALITMLVITMAYGWLILLPDEFEQLGKHVAAGTLFIQNIVFWQESGYFDTAATLKPLLHLWSLAVEEQFYIFFPLLLILLWRKPKILAPAMLVLLIATFILNVVMSVQNRASDFFLTPYRAWEFLGGSLLAWRHYDHGHEEEVPLYRDALSWGGAILLGVGMAFIHTGDPYPGWRALLPFAGTLMLMEGGAGGLKGAWVNRKILSNPAVVWVGLISYPLYLFHWPALSFVHIVKGEKPKPIYIIEALGIALLLTILTYHFIEKKLRHHKSRRTFPLLVVAFIGVGIGGLSIWRGILVPQSSGVKSDEMAAASCDNRFFDKTKTISWGQISFLHGIGKGSKKTLFVGDSNMEQYAPRIVEIEQHGGMPSREALFLTCGGCPPIPGITEKSHPAIHAFNEAVGTLLAQEKGIDRVVIGANWVWYCVLPVSPYSINGHYFPSAEAQNEALVGISELIAKLKQLGKKTYLVLNIAVGPVQDPRSSVSRSFTCAEFKDPIPLTVNEFDQQYSGFLKKLKITAEQSGAMVIDPLTHLAKDGFYPRSIGGIPIYLDSCHLRASFVRDHIIYLDETVAE